MFTAKIDTTVTPATLTVTSDFRKLSVTVTSQGQTTTAVGTWPLVITDDSKHAWVLKSDDGSTAQYTY